VSCVVCLQLAEMVNLHFLSLMESLQESNSVLLAKVGWVAIGQSVQPRQALVENIAHRSKIRID